MKREYGQNFDSYIGFFTSDLGKRSLVETAKRLNQTVSMTARQALTFGLLVLLRQWQANQAKLEAEIQNALLVGSSTAEPPALSDQQPTPTGG